MQKKQTIDQVLRATWQAIAKMYNEQASKYDSTMAMAFVLLNIDKKNGTPSTSLGPKMGMESTSLSRILKSMEDKGAIYREPNPNDGRGVLIKLTEEGKEKRNISREFVLKFDEAIRNSVGTEKIQHFFEVIDAILHLVNNKQITVSNEKINNLHNL